MGVVGSVGLLQTVTFSSQPISSLDWSPDKVTACTHTDTHRHTRVIIAPIIKSTQYYVLLLLSINGFVEHIPLELISNKQHKF